MPVCLICFTSLPTCDYYLYYLLHLLFCMCFLFFTYFSPTHQLPISVSLLLWPSCLLPCNTVYSLSLKKKKKFRLESCFCKHHLQQNEVSRGVSKTPKLTMSSFVECFGTGIYIRLKLSVSNWQETATILCYNPQSNKSKNSHLNSYAGEREGPSI